jgi:hypothetical protein
MLSTAISALALSVLHENTFLFIVGIFTLYLVGTGYRYLNWKKSKQCKMPGAIDWLLFFMMLIAGILFTLKGTLLLFCPNLFGLVLITFGLLGLLFTHQDFKNFKGKVGNPGFWLSVHLQRMTGGFIAAMTAFLVVNAKYFPEQIPGFIFWLLPTVILTPLIIRWSRQYQPKSTSYTHD